jgi:hypothetical protein
MKQPPPLLYVVICLRPACRGLMIELACETEKEAVAARRMHAHDFGCLGAHVYRYSLQGKV